jgi:NitT/TauT family transport system permease protein
LIVLFVGLAAWEAAGLGPGLVRDVIGTPAVVGAEVLHLLRSSDFYDNLGVTVLELSFGLALSVALGLVLALGFGSNAKSHDVIEPLLLIGNTIPKVILLPAFLMLLGVGTESKIAFGALHGMLPVAFMVSNGARRTIASEQMRAAVVMNATRFQIVRSLLLPSVLPYLASALRLAVSLTLLGVILGEMYVARAGLGFLLMRRYTELQIPQMLGIVVIIGALAAALDFALRLFEARVWRIHGFRQDH